MGLWPFCKPTVLSVQAAEARAKKRSVMTAGPRRLGGRSDTATRLTPAQVRLPCRWVFHQDTYGMLSVHDLALHARACSGSRRVPTVRDPDRPAQAAAQAAERRARDDAACPSGTLGTQNVGYSDADAEVVVLSDHPAAPQRPSAPAPEVSRAVLTPRCTLIACSYLF